MRITADLCGHAGRIEEGREAIERLLELYPGMTMDRHIKSASIYIEAEPRAIVAEGLRKAGLSDNSHLPSRHVAGYSRLMGADEGGTLKPLGQCRPVGGPVEVTAAMINFVRDLA